MQKSDIRNKKIWKRIGGSKERNYVIENLSTLVASGVGIIASFRSLRREIKSKRLERSLSEVQSSVERGVPLWRAMDQSGIFPESMIVLIRLGEASGRLSENLRLVAEQNRKNRMFRSKLQSAMLYPLFVLGITFVVGIGIAWFILPKLATVFDQLKVELPLVTKIIIHLGILLRDYGVIIVPIFIVIIVAIVLMLFVVPRTKHIGQTLLFRTPGLGRLIHEVEISRFGYLFGSLIKAGVSVTEALELLEYATQIRAYKKFYKHLHEQISHGYSLDSALKSFNKSSRLIPHPVQQMIIAGEQSGNLSEMLLRVAEMYEEKTDNTTKNVAVLLEPVLLVIVWLGVLVVALAVILPVYSLLGGVR